MKSREIRKKSILRAFTVLSSMTLVSRITGYIRDAVIAAFLGASIYSDAFFVAFRIPNMFRRLFGEGALTPAIIPVVSGLIDKPAEQRNREIKSIIGTATLIVAIVTIFGVIIAPYLVKALAFGFTKDENLFQLTTKLTRIMFPYLFFISLVAVFMGILNAYHHFFAPAFSPTLLNLSMIASLLILRPFTSLPVFALAIGVLIGGLLQLLIQLPYLKQNSLPLLPSFDYKSKAVKEVLHIVIPSIFGLAITQINILVDTLVASFLKSGTVSYLYYADRLLELPIGIFTVSFASALLPSISSKATNNDIEGVRFDFNKTLIQCMLFILPSMFFLLFFGQTIISVLFKRKAFDAIAEIGSFRALIGYSLGLPFFTFNRLITPLFYAYKKTKEPVKAGFFAMLVNIIMDITLMPLGEFGLALATTLSGIANTYLLYSFFNKNHYSLNLKDPLKTILKIFIAGTFSIGISKLISLLIPMGNTFVSKIIILILYATIFMILFIILLEFFKVEEHKKIWKRIRITQ
ncbi:MAG: murein biosynthesis integral membrane protein MurJ [Proteobacteria bacterium]|nr:murein biosynthesis integral membrane protein MurJ [Pseudomonadota bacterium]